MTTPDIRVVADGEQLARTAADQIVQWTQAAIQARGRCAIALSGGSTPKRLFSIIGGEPWGPRIDWSRLHAFIVDERFVPPDHEDSNQRMIRQTLLAGSPLPEANFHPIPYTENGPEAAASQYEDELRRFFGDGIPRFDVMLLGMGADGHTASLFPGTPAPDVTDKLVIPSVNPGNKSQRISLTLPVLNASQVIAFIVGGADKADTVRAVVEERRQSLPAARVASDQGSLTWLLDEAAAASLSRRPS